ncbi:MAG: hypothetical protein P8J32_03930, partial [bacterium]|nr:hypothetical protein [bacterium]
SAFSKALESFDIYEEVKAALSKKREQDSNDVTQEETKKDACYHKVKGRYKVWPSAYASGALTKCRKVGAANWGNSTDESEMEEAKKKRKLTAKPSSEKDLGDWFARKSGGWVDCNTCRKDSKTGKKKCKPCGRKDGEKRAKYPACRPTPGACSTKGKGEKWGKKSEAYEDLTKEEWDEANALLEKASGWEECKPSIEEAEYKGRKVKLGKPMRGDVKKFKVYVKNDKGNVVKVNFGQKGVKIKKNNPKRRKSFRARHGCDNPGPRWKAKYWSCRKW